MPVNVDVVSCGVLQYFSLQECDARSLEKEERIRRIKSCFL